MSIHRTIQTRGVKLGGDRGYRDGTIDHMLGTATLRQQADQSASRILDAINAVRADQGVSVSLNGLARALTDQGIETPRGGAWTATAVRRALARVA